MHLDEIAPPDTAAATAADQVARRYCSPALYAHSVRSYLWGVAYARRGDLQLDVELLFVAAMLHDIGLTRPFDAHEMAFEEAGGQGRMGRRGGCRLARGPVPSGRGGAPAGASGRPKPAAALSSARAGRARHAKSHPSW